MDLADHLMLARRGLIVGATALIGVGHLRASAQTQPIRAVTMRSAAPSLTTGVPLTMIATGTDRANGIAVDLQATGTSSTIIVDAVLSGQADFGSPGTADALQAIRQGANLRIIAAIVNNLQVMVIRDEVMRKLAVSPHAPIAERVKALKGLILGTGAIGSTHYQILRAYLKQYGIDPDKDVRLVGMGETAALISGMEQKRFDAIAYASPIVDFAIAKGGATTWISGPRGDIPGSNNVKTCVIVTRADTLEKRPADVDALRAALKAALGRIHADRVMVGDVLHDRYFPKLEPSVWTGAWNGAETAYPASLAFTRAAYQYWIENDPKGPDGYKDVDYQRITYAPAQSD